MSVKDKYKRIIELEKELSEIIKVIEIIDPIRNDTSRNDCYEPNTRDPLNAKRSLIRLPKFKAWLTRSKNKLTLSIKEIIPRVDTKMISYEIESEAVIDAISKVLCEKRDWYRKMIKDLNEDEETDALLYWREAKSELEKN